GETSGDALLDALDQAEQAKLIRSHGSGRAPVYGYSHELIRATLLGGLSLPRRQRKHLKIADAIEQLSRGRIESRDPGLAYHTYQAGAAADVHRTIEYQVAAANQALFTGAYEEALRLAEQALSLHEDPGTKQEAELIRLKAVALRSLGRYTHAIDMLETAF